MRDALSLLDQCISYKEGGELKYEDTLDILGIANTDILFKLVDNIIDRELEKALFNIDDIITKWKRYKSIYKGFNISL